MSIDAPNDPGLAKVHSHYAYPGMNTYPDSLGRSSLPAITDQSFSGVLLWE